MTMQCVHDWHDDGNRMTVLSVTATSQGDPAYNEYNFNSDEVSEVEAGNNVVNIVSIDMDEAAIVVTLGEAAQSLHTSSYDADDHSDSDGTDVTTLTLNATTGSTEDEPSAGLVGSKARLQTNSTGLSDYVSYALMSKPYGNVTIQLVSDAPDEANIIPPQVVFVEMMAAETTSTTNVTTSTDAINDVTTVISWQKPKLVKITGRNTSGGKTVTYDIAQLVSTEDTTYAQQGAQLELLTVVNEYPAGTGDIVNVIVEISNQTGFSDFAEFLETEEGSVVWYIIGIVVFIVIVLVVSLVILKCSYVKKIKQERQAAIEEREAIIAGSKDVEISWNEGGDKIKPYKVVAVSTGSDLSNISVVDEATSPSIEDRMQSMLIQLRSHLKVLLSENLKSAAQFGRPSYTIPDETLLTTSEDASALMTVIKQLKQHNYKLKDEFQANKSSVRPKRKVKRSRRKRDMM